MGVFGNLAIGANVASGLMSGIGGLYFGQKNYELQKEMNEQNEKLMRESWQREDQAVQRRMADLKAAGINPVLAAGQSANTSAPIRLATPQYDTGNFQSSMKDLSGEKALAMMQVANNLRRQDKELSLLEREKEIKNWDGLKAQAQAFIADAQKQQIYNDNWIAEQERFFLHANDSAKAKEIAKANIDRRLAEAKGATIDTSQKEINYKMLQDLGYSGRILGLLKDLSSIIK